MALQLTFVLFVMVFYLTLAVHSAEDCKVDDVTPPWARQLQDEMASVKAAVTWLGANVTSLRADVTLLRTEFHAEQRFGVHRAQELSNCIVTLVRTDENNTIFRGTAALVVFNNAIGVASAKHNLKDLLWRDVHLGSESGPITRLFMESDWVPSNQNRDVVVSVNQRLVHHLLNMGKTPCSLEKTEYFAGERVVTVSFAHHAKVSFGEIAGVVPCDLWPAKRGDLLVAGRIRRGFSGTGATANHAFLGIAIAEVMECDLACHPDACNNITDPADSELFGVVVPASVVRDTLIQAMKL